MVTQFAEMLDRSSAWLGNNQVECKILEILAMVFSHTTMALDELLEKQLFHNDVKPSNIILFSTDSGDEQIITSKLDP